VIFKYRYYRKYSEIHPGLDNNNNYLEYETISYVLHRFERCAFYINKDIHMNIFSLSLGYGEVSFQKHT